MSQTGLILEGGANRGIFTSGVLDCLQDHGIYLPYVVAVSVGTCNAIDYVSKQRGRTRACMIPRGRNIPPICWKNIFIKGKLINLDMVFDEYPNRLVPFHYEAFWDSGIRSEYVVTNSLTGRAEYFPAPPDRDAERLMNICRASCSMPYLLPEVHIDGVPYVDGGCADPIPFRHAMEIGYEKNIVVTTRTFEYAPKRKSSQLRRIERFLYRRYPKLAEILADSDIRYEKQLKDMSNLEKEGRLLVIRPTKELAGRLENSQIRLEAFYRQGYELAERRLKDIRSFIE